MATSFNQLYGQLTGPNQTFRQDFFSANPDVAYQYALNQAGAGGYDPFSQFARNAFSRQYNTFLSALPTLPVDSSFTDWLGTNGLPGLRQQFQALSPSQRGENPSQTVGRMRWII